MILCRCLTLLTIMASELRLSYTATYFLLRCKL